MGKELWGPAWMQRHEVKDRKQAFTNNMTYDNYLIRKGLIREAEHIGRDQIEQMQMRGNGKMVSDIGQTERDAKDSRGSKTRPPDRAVPRFNTGEDG